MRSVLRWGPAALTAGILALLLAAPARADDPKAPADKAAGDRPAVVGPADSKGLDEAVYTNLKEIINEGAELYNSGDWAGCYRLFEGSLRALRPIVGHRPEWQKAITDGLAEAERSPYVFERAWALRRVMDKMRADVHPPTKTADTMKQGGTAGTLWDRLGGEKGVAKVIDDVTKLAAADPKVDFSRGGKYKPTDADLDAFKKSMLAWISAQTGGPLKYTGKSMKEVHQGMGITDAQFDALKDDIRKVLDQDGVKPDDAAAVLQAVEATRKDIVEAKPADAATVQGKVTFKGQPVADGNVIFVDAGGKKTMAALGQDGSYKADKLPPGTYKLAVDAKNVPDKYKSADTSGLTLDVQKGDQTHDVALAE